MEAYASDCLSSGGGRAFDESSASGHVDYGTATGCSTCVSGSPCAAMANDDSAVLGHAICSPFRCGTHDHAYSLSSSLSLCRDRLSGDVYRDDLKKVRKKFAYFKKLPTDKSFLTEKQIYKIFLKRKWLIQN